MDTIERYRQLYHPDWAPLDEAAQRHHDDTRTNGISIDYRHPESV